MASTFGIELRRLRLAAGLSLREFARLVHYDAGYLSRIENGLKTPSVELVRSCDSLLDGRGQLTALASTAPAAPWQPHEHLPCSATTGVEEIVRMAAERARGFGLAAQATSAEVVGLIYDEVRDLAQEYPRRPITELLGRLVEVQDVAFQVLEDRARPADARQLYLLAGVASGMIAKASHDLAQSHAAMTQSRTALVCAEQSGHLGLQAWIRGLQALIAYWAGRPAEAVRHCQAGTGLSVNTTSIWLPISEARGWAARGNDAEALAAIQRAEAAADHAQPDDLDALGGMGTFGRTRMQYYAADALAWLAAEADAAEVYAERAVAAYSDPSSSEWAFGDQAGSHAALSTARIGRGEIDGAAEALAPVLRLGPEQRINGIISAVQRVGHTIRRSELGVHGDELAEQIESFVRTPAAALPR